MMGTIVNRGLVRTMLWMMVRGLARMIMRMTVGGGGWVEMMVKRMVRMLVRGLERGW
jgi:hypothetical protein